MFVVLSDPAIYEYENAPPQSQEWLQQRFSRLEAGASPDGSELWLNWVIRRNIDQRLAGYVQATVTKDYAMIAYELNSHYWGKGIAQEAVSAVLQELAGHYSVKQSFAVLKAANLRSARLLQKLGFVAASPAELNLLQPEGDEIARSLPLI